jgi:serine kinase of HPr protein (carbohydrate metabolism regulator)
MEALLVASGCFVLLARNIEEAEAKLEANERLPDFLVSEMQFENGLASHDVRQRLEALMQIKLPMLVVTKYGESEQMHSSSTPQSEPKSPRLLKPAGSEEILGELSRLMSPPLTPLFNSA